MPSSKLNFLNIKDSYASPAGVWYAGNASVNSGDNTNWTFTGVPLADLNYLSIKDSLVTPTGIWYAGSSSVDAGNDTNWIFQGFFTSTATDGVSNAETTDATATKPIANINYLNIVDSFVSPGYWFAGNGSVNGGNDTNWIFTGYFASTVVDPFVSEDSEDRLFITADSVVEDSFIEDSLVSQVSFQSSIIEPAVLAEEETTQTNFNAARVENSNLSDIPVSQVNFLSAIVEPSTLADSENRVAVFTRSATDGFSVADTEDRNYIGNPTVVEALVAQDIVDTTNNTFHSFIVEDFLIEDVLIARGWFTINDTQNPNWVPVNNYQG